MAVRGNNGRSALGLAGLLCASGLSHFRARAAYEPLIPPMLPGRSAWWVWGSGVAELCCAAGLVNPGTRRSAAMASAWLLVAVFPGNLWMAWTWRHRGPAARAVAIGRLPLQVPLVLWARRAGG